LGPAMAPLLLDERPAAAFRRISRHEALFFWMNFGCV
jgi:hypothetical protein